jgi:flagellin-like hook-associated protein FlgL
MNYGLYLSGVRHWREQRHERHRSGHSHVRQHNTSGQPQRRGRRACSRSLLPAEIIINRRDGTTVSTVDLKGLTTVQQVIDAITAVDVNLTASLNTVGGGISITDTSGIADLEVLSGTVAEALGLEGKEIGGVNTVPLVGKDVNPQLTGGVFGVLVALSKALRSGDDVELSRLDKAINSEIERFSVVRGDLGGRLKLLDEVEDRLLDEDLLLQQTLSLEFDADLTEVISRVSSTQTALTATIQIAATSLQLNLLSFL